MAESLEIIEALVQLHTRRPMKVVEMDCVERDCGHEDGQCPVLADAVCSECFSHIERAFNDPWEQPIAETVFWPCATARELYRIPRRPVEWVEPEEKVSRA